MSDRHKEGDVIWFGDWTGSFDKPPVRVGFTAGTLGMRGEIIYEGTTEKVLGKAGLPLQTEEYDLTPPNGRTSHSWSARVETEGGEVLGYTTMASVIEPENGETFKRLAYYAVDTALYYPADLTSTPPYGTA